MDDDTLVHAQQNLEETEDIIASVVENLQLGRLNDCFQQYSILQKNLVSLALALDNYPADDSDPYELINVFPDEIMRKDILDEFRPAGHTQVPKAPLPPPCQKCASQNVSSQRCRGELDHIDLNCKFSDSEKLDFLHVAQVLEVRFRQRKPETTTYSGGSMMSKRVYRKWTSHERYTIAVTMALFGEKNYKAMGNVLYDRTLEQIRSFITKTFTEEEKEYIREGHILQAPSDYEPPRALLSNPTFLKAQPQFCNMALDTSMAPSQLTPRHGLNDWTSLLSIATGTGTGTEFSPTYEDMQFSPLPELTGEPALGMGGSSSLTQDSAIQSIQSLLSGEGGRGTGSYRRTIPKVTTITLSDPTAVLLSAPEGCPTWSAGISGEHSHAPPTQRPPLPHTYQPLPSCPLPAMSLIMPAPSYLSDALAATDVLLASAVSSSSSSSGPQATEAGHGEPLDREDWDESSRVAGDEGRPPEDSVLPRNRAVTERTVTDMEEVEKRRKVRVSPL
eukprot:CAMPEP_0182419234 /NCGR_PEP_ID=MMETSP1167-20130531/3664_1 /TAXON_ID=2988 /ORGANISM="Mallomonas Sp, Strain CCMP3275" /LENGTH=503 /DNA_ID=CAMNT_0024593981 /DNA_START=154 /DNA_END=1662 /DNA_ORIENTATION=+